MSKKLVYLVSFALVMGLVNSATAELVGHWRLDEVAGDTANDSSGNGNHGTLQGNPQWVAGKIGGALDFNGTNDYIEIPFSESLKLLNQGDFTLAVWFKSEEISSSGEMLFSQACGRFWLGSADDIASGIGGPVVTSEVDVDIETGTWYHAAVVVTEGGATDNIQLYVNGEPVGTPGQLGMEYCEGIYFIGCNSYRYYTTFWDGLIDDVRLYNHALSGAEITKISFNPKASKPSPADGKIQEDKWASLEWVPGDYAASHDVYFGDSLDDVETGAESVFQGNQTDTFFLADLPGFPYPEGLVPGTTYYWRIDEVNETDPNSPWKGDVWSFTVLPKTAYDPNPANGAKFVDTNVELSWTAGFGAKLHTIYFGENFEDVNNVAGGLPQGTLTYNPGTLKSGKTYYWRVDEVGVIDTYKGDVWSFKTLPVIPITDPNLVGWWKFDEGMGTTAFDWSGHGNHGIIFGIGSEWIIPGLLGDAALNFSASNYMAIQHLSYNSTGNTGVTVCAWIRTSSESSQVIVSFGRNEYWCFSINSQEGGPGRVSWDVMTSSGQVYYASISRVDDGLWRHITGVFDNGLLTIYIDGLPEPSASGGSTFGSGKTRFGFIGAKSKASSFNGEWYPAPFKGDLDDMRIYDKALTQEEIILVILRGNPLLAWDPSPGKGTTLYIRDAMPLSWSPGDNASQHDVYFGTDENAVYNADASDTTGIYHGRQGATSYNPPEGDELGGGPYYWRIDEFDGVETHKGDIWSFTPQGVAVDPNPSDGAVDVTQTPILSWNPGVYSGSHEVYFGTDKDAVKNADTGSPEYKGSGNLGSENYNPGQLEWNTTYYWRIDEVNNKNADNPWTDPVWSFTTANFLIVDDFESYNDLIPIDPMSNRIFNVWIDGYDDPTNGSLVGYENPPFAEQTIVHSGSQSLPLYYDNSVGNSEATLTLTYPRDWTEKGVNTLTIWFRGDSANAAETLYVALNGSAVVNHDNPNAAQVDTWTEWNIDLQAFADQGVNLANVNSIALGLGNRNNPVAGGSGTMYFDDIRLYPPSPEPTP